LPFVGNRCYATPSGGGIVKQEAVSSARKSRAIWLFGIVLAAILIVWPRTFPLDDAYITLHNVRSLLAGSDRLYDTHPLAGATSSIHVLCVALFGLVMPLPDALLLIGTASLGLYAWGLWKLHQSVPFVFIGMTASFVPVWLFNGLETSMAMAAVTWAFVLADNRRLPLLLGLMPFIRPDLLLLAAPLAIRQARERPLQVLCLGLLTSLPFAAWLYISTGAPFPTTASAKLWFFAEFTMPIRERFSIAAIALAMSFLPILMGGLAGLWTKRAGWCGLIYIVGLLALGMLLFPQSLNHNDHRYLAPIVPILCYGLTVLPRRAIYAIAAISALTGANAFMRLRANYSAMAMWHVGADAVAKLKPGSTVMVHDAGVVAWRKPPVRLVDFIGLKTPSTIPVLKKHRVRRCQWGAAISDIAARSRATHIVILESPTFSCIVPDLRRRGWKLESANRTRLHIYTMNHPVERRSR
jgi:hypothetical protein